MPRSSSTERSREHRLWAVPAPMKLLWLVPARAGSRSILDKNIALLGGHPMLAWRVAAARQLADQADVWISTDSERYAEIAADYGATVPFLRPAELARDDTPSADVVIHALEHARARNLSYDGLVLLEPTSPFVLPETMKDAVARLEARPDADGVVATRKVHPASIYIQPETEFLTDLARRIGVGAPPRRQQAPVEVTPSGGFYIARWERFLAEPSFFTDRTLGHRVGEVEGLDIDEQLDLEWGRFLVASGRVDTAVIGLPVVAPQAS